MSRLGLYLHIPFCRQKCLYCDFCSFPAPSPEETRAYTDALCRDLERRAPECAGYTVDTVYFGGGTPTLLPIGETERILSVVFSRYHVAPDAEITSECNPVTESRERFLAMRKMGFNRVSVGLQSAHGRELAALGRLHRREEFLRTVEDLAGAGIDNVSADVMFGIPEQTVESYLETLRLLVGLPLRHISAYSLTVEEGTPFGKMGDALVLPGEEDVRKMYLDGIRFLSEHGFAQYEISNFARPGYESRHNLKYWNCDEYLGFGVAAFSDFGGERFGNSRDVSAYIDGREILAERETPSPSERLCEYVMLRMRLCEGLVLPELNRRFGSAAVERFSAALERYVPMGLVRRTEAGYAFSPEGFCVSNSVLSNILDFSG